MMDLAVGLACLGQFTMRPLFVRVGRYMEKLLHPGCLPHLNTTPFIEWDERKFNSVADHAANVSLDDHRDWEWRDPGLLAQARQQRWNLRVCLDGARRGDGQAAGGLAIYAYDCVGHGQVMLRAGRCLGILFDSFMAESLALELKERKHKDYGIAHF